MADYTIFYYYTSAISRVQIYRAFCASYYHGLWVNEINYIKLARREAYCVSFSLTLQPSYSPTVVSASYPCLVPESNMSRALSVDSKCAMKFRSNYLVIRADCAPVPRLRRAYL